MDITLNKTAQPNRVYPERKTLYLLKCTKIALYHSCSMIEHKPQLLEKKSTALYTHPQDREVCVCCRLILAQYCSKCQG